MGNVVYEFGFTGLHFSNRSKWEVSPRFGLKFLLTDNWRIKAGLGRHYQTLTSLNDEDDVIVLFDAWIPTPRDCELPQADHYGLGMEYTPNSALQIDLELYYRHYSELTRFNRTQRTGEPFYLDGWAESFGAEICFNFNRHGFYGFTNYAISKATSNFFMRNQPMRYEFDFRRQAFPSDGDVRHALKVVAGKLFNRKFEISLSGIYTSGRPYTAGLASVKQGAQPPFGTWDPYNESIFQWQATKDDVILSSKNAYRFPAYQRFDLRVAYNYDWLNIQWKLFVQIYNLLYRKNTAFHRGGLEWNHGERTFGLPFLPTVGLQFKF